MKFSDFLSFIGIIAILVALAYAIAKTENTLTDRAKAQTIQTIDVTGTRPDAPVPIQATLQLHADGSVTWKRPQ